MATIRKTLASKQEYMSPSQQILAGFETPFSQKLNINNRWVKLAHQIPWDTLVGVYLKAMSNDKTGAAGLNPRVAIGSLIIKHICDLSDRETVLQIQENMYMQYFIGYSSFSSNEPFDPSLFVEFRKRLGAEQINTINEKIMRLIQSTTSNEPAPTTDTDKTPSTDANTSVITHKGQLITDATACPQDIAYPTDLNLLNDAREKTEELIDILYNKTLHHQKPRTYRETARKEYLKTAQKKHKTVKEIRKAVGKQLNYLHRDIEHIHRLLDAYKGIPLNRHQHKYLFVIQTLYEQQLYMYQHRTHSIEHRIVSIHQPHVRPIVRGKANAQVEFGAKINVSLMNGIAFLDEYSWEAFNEGTYLLSSVKKYKQRFGYYPAEVLADKIYCNRDNRAKLKELDIKLKAKPLGRPKAVDMKHVSPGERNPIEGLFGQAKRAYGMNRIKARLSRTSQSWIATIIMVLNLVKLTGQLPYYLLLSFTISFSAKMNNFIWTTWYGVGRRKWIPLIVSFKN